jgi:hypothetical protein
MKTKKYVVWGRRYNGPLKTQMMTGLFPVSLKIAEVRCASMSGLHGFTDVQILEAGVLPEGADDT